MPQAGDPGPAYVPLSCCTIVVAGERVRLKGIDAPELHQTCTACGQQSAVREDLGGRLQQRLNGRKVECIGDEDDP